MKKLLLLLAAALALGSRANAGSDVRATGPYRLDQAVLDGSLGVNAGCEGSQGDGAGRIHESMYAPSSTRFGGARSCITVARMVL